MNSFLSPPLIDSGSTQNQMNATRFIQQPNEAWTLSEAISIISIFLCFVIFYNFIFSELFRFVQKINVSLLTTEQREGGRRERDKIPFT